MKQPHKHAEVLRAIADGIDVQWRADDWVDYGSVGYIHPNPITSSIIEWRIKPVPKPDVVEYMGFNATADWDINDFNLHKINGFFDKNETITSHWKYRIKLTFDGETGELKDAEVIK